MFDFLVYLTFRSFLMMVYLLPFRLISPLGRLAGRAYYHMDRRRRRIINANICVVFGRALDKEGRKALARESCEYLATHILELLKLHKVANPENYREFIEITGLSHLMKSVQRGRGTLVVSGHFGNFILIRYLCYLNIPPRGAIIRELDNPYLERFFRSIVKAHNAITIRPDGAIKRMLALLPLNTVLATLADQKAGGNPIVGRHGIVVDFFDIPSQTHVTAPLLARRTGAGIVPVFVVRRGTGRYRMEINEPLELAHTSNEAHDLKINTRKLNRIFEGYIRRFPHHWFWVHRRWKDIPGLEDLYRTNNPLDLLENFKRGLGKA
ncbi:MAG: lysophospholipid acyltransferase family protein [Deltaproteobacteria bacterium]|nr:lysophospholipid acyltransferase family protein [Deltaproteobacteria bacterium]